MAMEERKQLHQLLLTEMKSDPPKISTAGLLDGKNHQKRNFHTRSQNPSIKATAINPITMNPMNTAKFYSKPRLNLHMTTILQHQAMVMERATKLNLGMLSTTTILVTVMLEHQSSV